MGPELTIVIPTRDRHAVVEGAVESALGQTLADVEVVVVDDGSSPPLELAPRPRLRFVRRARAGGPSAARNEGLREARGRYVTFLDDDNRLLPHMAEASLEAIESSRLPPPVAAVSGIEVVRGGRVVERRLPPTHPRGDHFSLLRFLDRLAVMERLGRRRSRYLTGYYLAVSARKPVA